MTAFRVLLVILFAWITGYTIVVIASHGFNLFPVFFGDMAKMGWAGQFNADFMSFLALSAAWLAWRHHFSPLGLGLAVLGFFGGALFLSVYLFVESFRVQGDVRALLLGEARAAAGP
jgi:hypothetical protein